ncbi:hypothetical protein SAMN02745196_02670 [Clostridium collagenovorans DSM 3089]|uniref:Uncharacterized protein n=1 Tax=Clostridium collagenovorans DSM 3089 TaxID=1121306 RepID=A0A1M5Y508_9CLOT|nr:DUF5317 family protein [Clostridium collagenovorans]SHI07160.1 hypothetical protein SAMN02745196_02670 [Clostridium collagenovorans DSM 3089]
MNFNLVVKLFLISIIFSILIFSIVKNENHKLAINIMVLIIITGALLGAVGLTLNLIVVEKNYGKMPVSTVQGEIVEDYRHIALSEEVKYEFLTDKYYLTFPCKGMYSIGDILAGIGVVMAFSTMGNVVLLAKSKRI